MDATIALTGRGGWPMSVFTDADSRPFYAGTYFPPEPRHGMPAFTQVLLAITDSWQNRRDDVAGAAGRITKALTERDTRIVGGATPPEADDLAQAVQSLAATYDSARGGFGRAPKFPPSMVLEFLARQVAGAGDTDALVMLQGTCEAMARGGIYDQIGGGFARYSVDDAWVVPHFEKMLYDNALLLRVYLHWWRLTGHPLAERVVRETAEFCLREMQTPEGGFAAAFDADSEGVEGRYYVWTPTQLVEVLGEADGRWAAQLFEVTEEGTFEEGASTLQLLEDPDDLLRWGRVRAALLGARRLRVPPARDDKVVAAWNGLMIAALAEAGALLDQPRWVEEARRAADLLLSVHVDGSGRLARTSRDGVAGTSAGVLEDYADVAEGMLALYSVTGEEEWLTVGTVLLDGVLAHFGDGQGGFFDTADDAEQLLMRPRDPSDTATPSGWLAAAQALLTAAALTGNSRYREAAEAGLGVVTEYAEQAPRAVGWGLAASRALLAGPLEVAVVGPDEDRHTSTLHRLALMGTSPGAVVAVGAPGSSVPLLEHRPLVDGAPAVYVCRQFTCAAPVTTAEEVAHAVMAVRPPR